jgi:hypothetical protein
MRSSPLRRPRSWAEGVHGVQEGRTSGSHQTPIGPSTAMTNLSDDDRRDGRACLRQTSRQAGEVRLGLLSADVVAGQLLSRACLTDSGGTGDRVRRPGMAQARKHTAPAAVVQLAAPRASIDPLDGTT